MSAAPCPGPEELLHCVQGLAPEAQAAPISQHADSCASCRAALDALVRKEDSLLAGLRGRLYRETSVSEFEFRQALCRLEAEAGGPPAMATVVPDPVSVPPA